MICVSLAEKSLSTCLEALEMLDFAEIRMDAMPFLAPHDLRNIFTRPAKLIATCRPGGSLANEGRKATLIAAIESGAAYVDVEIESEPGYRDEIITTARSHGCEVIISFHDHEKTPERQELETITASCFKAGADIAKIACMVHSSQDNARLLGLLDTNQQVVVVGMGEKGRTTRIIAPLLGSPFTFASLSKGKETAEGQIDKETLEYILEVLTHQ
jgi:3-dehydroquinate dehydratase I